jgi:hypothetical protein
MIASSSQQQRQAAMELLASPTLFPISTLPLPIFPTQDVIHDPQAPKLPIAVQIGSNSQDRTDKEPLPKKTGHKKAST